MRKKAYLFITAMSLSVMLFSGCGNRNNNNSATSPDTTNAIKIIILLHPLIQQTELMEIMTMAAGMTVLLMTSKTVQTTLSTVQAML